MSEPTIDPQEPTASVDPQQEPTVSVEPKESEVDILRKEMDLIKKTQQGVDQANSKLRAEKEKLERDLGSIKETYMDEKTRLEYEKEQDSLKLELKAKEVEDAQRLLQEQKKELLINNFMLDNKIDSRLKGNLTGDTVEDLQTQYEGIKNIIDESVAQGVKKSIGESPMRAVANTNGVDTTDKSIGGMLSRAPVITN